MVKLKTGTIAILALVVLLVFLPLKLSGYMLHLLVVACIWIIVTQGLNIITGYTGLLNLGQAGLMGVGAYSAAALCLHGLPFWVALLVALLINALLGLVVGFPVLRTRGIYFAISTMALGVILFELFNSWISVTGGPMGLREIPRPENINVGIANISFDSRFSFYIVVLLFTVLTILLIYRMSKSTLGRVLIAIRDDQVLAATLGISPHKYKVMAFVMCSVLAGLGGALYANYVTYISPGSFDVMASIEYVVMVIAGSAGTIFGPILGTLILLLVPETLRMASEFRMILYAVVLAGVIIYMPSGLFITIRDLFNKSRFGRKVMDVYNTRIARSN